MNQIWVQDTGSLTGSGGSSLFTTPLTIHSKMSPCSQLILPFPLFGKLIYKVISDNQCLTENGS